LSWMLSAGPGIRSGSSFQSPSHIEERGRDERCPIGE
jgi:hypothetical protein